MSVLKKIGYYLLLLSSVLLIGITLVSLAYTSSLWYLKVLNFPRLLTLLALTGCLLLVLLTYRRNRKLMVAVSVGLLIAIAIQAYILHPYTPLTSRRVASVEDGVVIDKKALFSVLVTNVLMTNRESGKLLNIIRDKDPTFVLAMEVDTWWMNKLSVLNKRYPHRMTFPADNAYGMALYSKMPLNDRRILFFSNDSVPSFMANVTLPVGDAFQMLALHPVPPTPSKYPDNVGEKEVALMKAGRLMEKRSGPALALGDFNDVGWSFNTRQFSGRSGLNDVRVGRGMYSTFNAKLSILRWPLDYVFASKEFRVVSVERLPDIGSDHFPFYVKLALLPRLPAEADD